MKEDQTASRAYDEGSAALEGREPTADKGGGDHASARVSASTLHRLSPLLMDRGAATERVGAGQHLWGWRVEPCEAGGALVIATNGTSIGVIHEPRGYASRPVTILASEGLRAAVTPPPLKGVYYPGDYDEVPLPDEFQPGTVFATRVGVFVSRKSDDAPASRETAGDDSPMIYSEMAEFGNVWAGGYRLADEWVHWRRTFAMWKPSDTAPSHHRLAPGVLSSFRNIHDSTLDLAFPADSADPVLVRSWDDPAFVGLLMLGRMENPPPVAPALPAWLGSTDVDPEQNRPAVTDPGTNP